MKKILFLVTSTILYLSAYSQSSKYETKEGDIYLYDTISNSLSNIKNDIKTWNVSDKIHTTEKVTSLYPLLKSSLSQKRIRELAEQKATLIMGTSIDSTGCIKEVFFLLNPIMEEYLNKNKDFINEINAFEESLLERKINFVSQDDKHGYFRFFWGIRFHILYEWLSKDEENKL